MSWRTRFAALANQLCLAQAAAAPTPPPLPFLPRTRPKVPAPVPAPGLRARKKALKDNRLDGAFNEGAGANEAALLGELSSLAHSIARQSRRHNHRTS